jgi:hypothetical protein
MNYYGNPLGVENLPIVLNLQNVPVSYWRAAVNPTDGTVSSIQGEYSNTGCIFNSQVQSVMQIPWLNNYSPVESQSLPISVYLVNPTPSGCDSFDPRPGDEALKYDYFVDVDGLTHIFGDIEGSLSFGNGALLNGTLRDQYNGTLNSYDSKGNVKTSSKVTTVDMDIAPFNKIIYPSYETSLSIKPAPPIPQFSSISFNIPDPTENVDIDPQIPWILCGYLDSLNISDNQTYKGKTFSSSDFLKNYLKDYLFTPITGKDGQTIYGRIEFSQHPEYSSYPTIYSPNAILNKVITYFKKNFNTDFNTYSSNYCSLATNSGETLTVKDGWCATDYCVQPNPHESGKIYCDTNLTAFCQLGPDQKKYDDPNSIINIGQETNDTLINKFPNSINKICSNFMPQNYYPAKDYATVIVNSTKGDAKNTLTAIQQLINKQYYKNPDCTGIGSGTDPHTQSFYSYDGKQYCPNIDLCVNAVDFENYGTITGNVTINQSDSCNPDGPSSSPPSDPPSNGLSKAEKIGITVAAGSALLLLLNFV